LKVLLAHPGTQYSGRLASQLSRLGMLGEFHTGIAIADGGWMEKTLAFIPRGVRRRLANRQLRGVTPRQLHLHPFDELRAHRRQRAGEMEQKVLHDRNARFQDRIGDASLKCDAVIGFDTSSWKLARRCRELAVPLVLDQSIGHPDSKSRVYAMLRDRYPQWAQDADVRLDTVRQAEQVEHDLAHTIVAASSFSRATLIENGVAAEKISVNAYGVDSTRFAPRRPRGPGPARICFLGSVNVRKGVPQLLEAWDALAPREAELWIIGPAGETARRLMQGRSNVVYKGATPHTELPALLAQCDVLAFPSFFEGFALVILEAMACGLPVITTDATAGPDIITHGQDGWIVRVGDDGALRAALDECLSHPARVAEAGIAARATAERFTWDAYGDRWRTLLERVAGSSDH
jgi:glycosyltransferase involved in cell wall biosynthesis